MRKSNALADYIQRKKDAIKNRQSRLAFVSEQALCNILIDHLRANGYETYHEVEAIGGRIDIVAVKDGKQWAIEAKATACRSVLNQAYNWINRCHYVSIASPFIPIDKFKNFADNTGIGVIQIIGNDVLHIKEPTLWPSAIGVHVFEEQKNNRAGSRSGGHWTPNKEQRLEIKDRFNLYPSKHIIDTPEYKQLFKRMAAADFPQGIKSEVECD